MGNSSSKLHTHLNWQATRIITETVKQVKATATEFQLFIHTAWINH
jgi:hypothetical protein